MRSFVPVSEPVEHSISGASEAPEHVAIIMDGNRRWARAHMLPAIEGHRRGAKILRTICRTARDSGVRCLTVYAFSQENWSRERLEVNLLLELCRHFARGELSALRAENVHVRIIGRTADLPESTRTALRELEEGTAHCDGLRLNLAINYGARAEMADAAKAIALDVASGKLRPDEVNEETFGRYLYTADLPDPELLIRTGGELRLSNFLLYQVAYTEFWSTPTCWPEFTPAEFRAALAAFAGRRRRFGA